MVRLKDLTGEGEKESFIILHIVKPRMNTEADRTGIRHPVARQSAEKTISRRDRRECGEG
jgi:hypothetical protein